MLENQSKNPARKMVGVFEDSRTESHGEVRGKMPRKSALVARTCKILGNNAVKGFERRKAKPTNVERTLISP